MWPNWIRRLTTNQKIGGSSPSRDIFYFFLESEKIKPVEESYAQAGPFHAWMPEWSKGADLRSAGQFVRVGSNPTPGSNLFLVFRVALGDLQLCSARGGGRNGACSVMAIIGAFQALDPGSIPGERSFGALAQSEECALCKREVRGSKPRCSILLLLITFFFFFDVALFPSATTSLDGRAVQGARLKFESLRRRGFESHSKHFFGFGGNPDSTDPRRIRAPESAGHWSSGMILL